MYNKKIKTTPSTYFCRPSRVLRLFPTRCKNKLRFFLTLHRPTKIYVKSNLQTSGNHCKLSEHACSMLTVYKSDTRMLLYRKQFDALKLMEDTEIHLLWEATWRMIEIALLRTCQLSAVHVVVKKHVLWCLSQR
jgi:hypothetical protein